MGIQAKIMSKLRLGQNYVKIKIRPKLPTSSDISTQHCGPKQDILIKLYQKELRQLLGYGIYMIMLMILTFNKDPQV